MNPDDLDDYDNLLEELAALLAKMEEWRDDPDFHLGDQGYQDMGQRETEIEERIERLNALRWETKP